MIEFNCSGCQTLLRLPDDMGGLRGKCTRCGEILHIPTATEHYWPPGAKVSTPAASLSGVRAAQTTATNSAARSRAGQAASPAGKPSAPPNNPADTVVYSVSDTVVVATSKSTSSKSSPGSSAARPAAPGNSGVLDAGSSIQPSSSSIFSASGVIPIAPGNSNVLNGNSSIGRVSPAGASGLASGKSSGAQSAAPGKSGVQNGTAETPRPVEARNSSVSSAAVPRPAVPSNSGVLTGNSSVSRAVVPGSSGISKSGASRPVPLGPDEDDEPAQKKPAAAPSMEVKDVVKRAWGIFRANLGAMIGAAIVFFIVGATIVLATAGVLQSMQAPVFVAGLLIQALTIWLTMGALSFVMKTARGRRPGIGELFKQLPLYGPALAIWALYFCPMWAVQGICFALNVSSGPASLIAFLGSTLISWFLWLPAQLALIDGQTTAANVPMASLRYACRNFKALSALYLIAGAVIVVSLLPVLLGFPLALPFVAVMATVAYLLDGRAR